MRLLRAACLLSLMLATPAVAPAAPVLGFIERFNTGTTTTWSSAASNTNPGTGGADGAGDGYLRVAQPTVSRLATKSTGPEYTGDWIAANVNKLNLCLNDVDANQPLAIHVCVGNSINFWLYKTAFSPPENSWALYTVDLTDSTNFTQVIGGGIGSFAGALRNTDRVQVRHDNPPFDMPADAMIGEFGIDNVELTNSTIGVEPLPSSAGRPVELSAPYPNPARGAVACAFDAFDESPVRMTIFDAAGRLVRAETLAGAAPGRRTWIWDGLDAQGRLAPAGAYRVRAIGRAGGTSRAIIRVN